VVQQAGGRFVTQEQRPKKGHYTIVDMSQPVDDQVRFVKQASPTAEEAFDYGEHPKESLKHLSQLQRFKKQLAEKNADLTAIQAEMFDYVRRHVPKAEQHRFLSILQRVNPKARTKTTLKDLGRVIAQTEEMLRGNDKREAIAELKSTWKQIQKRYRRGSMRLGKLNRAARERIEKLMDGIDLKKMTAAKREQLQALGKRIGALTRELGAAMQSVDPETGAMLLDVPEARIKEMARLGQTSIHSMTADDIRTITDTLKYIVHQYETERSIIRENERAERSEVLKKMLAEVVPTREARRRAQMDLKGLPQEIKRPTRRLLSQVAKVDSAHLDTLAELMTGPGETETRRLLYDDLNEGWRRRTAKVKEAFDYLRGRMKEIGFTYADFRSITTDTIEIEIGDVKRNVPVEYVMDLYMHTQNGENMQRLLTTTGHRLRGEILPAFSDAEQIIAATDKLTDKQRAFCDLYAEVNTKILAPAVNEVSLQIEGTELATNPNHWRIHRVLPKKVSGRIVDVAIEDTGPFQPRTGGKQPIELRPFTQEFVNNIQNSAMYYGMATPMRNLRSIVNTAQWQDAMRAAGHERLVNAAITILRRVQGYRTDQSVAEMYGQKLLSKFARSVLGLRISTIGNQVLSAPVAVSELRSRHFAKALTKADIRARVKTMMERSPVFWERWTGRKINIEVGSLMAQHTMETLIWDKNPILEKPMKGLVWGDMVAIAKIHAAAEAEIRAEQPNLSGDELQDVIIARTEYITRRTQPMWDMLNRSVLSGSPSLWLRLGLIFRSAREKQWNVLLRANNALVKDWRANKIRALAQWTRAVDGVVAANVSIAAWKNALRWGLYTGSLAALAALGLIDPEDRDLPDEDERRSLAAKLAEESAGNVLSLAPGGQHLQNALKVAGKRLRNEPVWQPEPYDNPIGEIFNIGFQLAADQIPKMVAAASTGDRFRSGPRKGQLKWRAYAAEAIANATILTSYVAGIPLPGPKSEFYWPIQRALREHENGYRMMTNPERLLALKEATYAESQQAFPREPEKWIAHAGQEAKVEKIKRALDPLTTKDLYEMNRLRAMKRREQAERSRERQRQLSSMIRESRQGGAD